MVVLYLIGAVVTLFTDMSVDRVTRLAIYLWRVSRFRLHILGLIDWAEAPQIYQRAQPQPDQPVIFGNNEMF